MHDCRGNAVSGLKNHSTLAQTFLVKNAIGSPFGATGVYGGQVFPRGNTPLFYRWESFDKRRGADQFRKDRCPFRRITSTNSNNWCLLCAVLCCIVGIALDCRKILSRSRMDMHQGGGTGMADTEPAVEQLLTAQEVAKELRVSDATVIRWCRSGKLPALKAGKAWRISQEDLRQWKQRHRSIGVEA